MTLAAQGLAPRGPSVEASATACDAASAPEGPSPAAESAAGDSRQSLDIQPSSAAAVDAQNQAEMDGPTTAASHALTTSAQPELQDASDAQPPYPVEPAATTTTTTTTTTGVTMDSINVVTSQPPPEAAAPETRCLERPATPTKHSIQPPPWPSHATSQPCPGDAGHPASSSPLSAPPSSISPLDRGDVLDTDTSPATCSSPMTRNSPVSSPLSEFGMEIAGRPIEYDYDGPAGHRLLRLKPTPSQWVDFPSLLSLARRLHTEGDGCFKIVLPNELRDPLPQKNPQRVPANAYRVRQIRKRMFWQVSTVGSDGVFSSSEPEEANFSESAEVAIKNLKMLFNKNKERQMRNVRYRVDVPAWTAKQRREAGVPERSPIHPLEGDKLDCTKAIIPGIHTPYVYESGPHFGATFQFHAEDFRLTSLNHLYKGRKIWIVIPSTAVDLAEKALNRNNQCSQFMRHRAEFFFPERLEKMGIPYRIVDQRPGETIVILPDAYHEGFSTGYTIAEAKNYADPTWTTDTYQPCEASCRLATAIPAEFMRPLREGEERLDLCAPFGDGMVAIQQPPPEIQPTLKRGYEQEEGGNDNTLLERETKHLKVY